ncbi:MULTISPECIES: T9SS type A sorting domain-containing protein [Bacteroides]|uniref:T9SS type A sorting domain-containing protein n=1 Tax=Bacteroides TaxID=816 RepID=UPI00033E60AB|nr:MULTISPECIES: T9SS type A sorting domain-containing protein [Bacteroides]UYU43290.1 T9SS type A sorting domain-containing protein [Bacteroides salyersiae]CCY51817.1 conserved hypothetical membrane protein [Bacteroides sp. CAG:189]
MRKITYFIAALALLGSTQFANAQEPTTAAPTPTYPEADVISFYGKTYEPASDHKLILRTNWGLSPDNFVDDYINKDAVLHMINLEWSSFYTNAGATVTDYDYLHFDFWPDQDCQFVVGVTWNYPAMADAYSEIFDLKANQWNSIDLPIENFDWTAENKNYVINGLRLGSRDGIYEPLSKQYAPNIYVSNIFAYKGSPTGIKSDKANNGLNIYPTAVTDYITIDSEEAVQSANLYAISGQLAGSYNMAGENQINLSALQSGSYIISVKLVSGKTVSKHIIKL